jgi:hypothetical protein
VYCICMYVENDDVIMCRRCFLHFVSDAGDSVPGQYNNCQSHFNLNNFGLDQTQIRLLPFSLALTFLKEIVWRSSCYMRLSSARCRIELEAKQFKKNSG